MLVEKEEEKQCIDPINSSFTWWEQHISVLRYVLIALTFNMKNMVKHISKHFHWKTS